MTGKHFGYIAISTVCALFCACMSSIIVLKNSPSDSILLAITPNSNTSVYYTFTSALPDTFVYTNKSDYSFLFALNRAFEKHVQSYMTTKFNTTDEKSVASQTIGIELLNCEMNYDMNQSGLDVAGEALGNHGIRGDGTLECRLTIKVSLSSESTGNMTKTIIGSKQNYVRFEGAGNDKPISVFYSETVNEVLDQSIILIDKYFQSLEL